MKVNVIDEAKKEFEVFNRLYQKVERLWKSVLPPEIRGTRETYF